jgi:type VI secretion system protein ImpM
VTASAEDAIGVYGKVPVRGDFITRRLGRPFVDAWDDWLQDAISASRDALAEHWTDVYLTSPIWRFALGDGCCGPNTVVGVVMPSVDSVGRYFPLMLGRELPAGIELMGVIARLGAWFQAVEERALATLEMTFRLEMLDEPMALGISEPFAPAAAGNSLVLPGHCIAVDPASGLDEVARVYGSMPRGRTLWWTQGSERVAPCVVLCPGLPRPSSFASFLDGEWEPRGWLAVRL